MGKYGVRCMNRKDRRGATGKLTRECDPGLTDAGTGAGRNQWQKLLQNIIKFIPDYMPSHSGRQAVSTVTSPQLTQSALSHLHNSHSQHCHIFTTHTVHVTSFYSTSTYSVL